MSYEVLARKLRPAGFDALVGQDHVVRALRHALDEGRLHHAYLFTGTRGVGKTTIARIIAKALNCEQGVSATPCGQCGICEAIRDNRFVDLIEVDAASRTGVDDTRELLENAQYLPTQGRFKVYLIDEVHMLSINSFNALLKTLEEPPEHVKFLLATTDPKKVPLTVLSRCLQFQLKNLNQPEIADYLAQTLRDEGVDFDEPALAIIARAAAGSMRDALSLTDQAIAYGEGRLRESDVIDMLGIVGRDEVASLLEALERGDAADLLARCAELAERNADFRDLLSRLLETFHDLAVAHALGESERAFAAEEVQLYYQIALIGLRDLELAPDERSGFEMTLLRMLAFAPGEPSDVPRRTSGDPHQAQPGSPADETTAAAQASPPRTDAAEDPSVTRASAGGEWFEIVQSLDVGGVTRMIAEHSNLLEMALPRVRLCLDQGHDTLLNDAQVERLQHALMERLGTGVELTIDVGELREESPAQRRARIARERQANAEQHIREDSNVMNLLAEFDASVEEIRPV